MRSVAMADVICLYLIYGLDLLSCVLFRCLRSIFLFYAYDMAKAARGRQIQGNVETVLTDWIYDGISVSNPAS